MAFIVRKEGGKIGKKKKVDKSGKEGSCMRRIKHRKKRMQNLQGFNFS
jgi:hypothetical protein